MPAYGRVTEVGYTYKKDQGNGNGAPPPSDEAGDPNGMQRPTFSRRPGMAWERPRRLRVTAEEAFTGPAPEELENVEPQGFNGSDGLGNGQMGDGPMVTEEVITAVSAALEGEACAYTVTEAEAYLAQLEMDERARQKKSFMNMALAALAGFAAGRMMR